MKSTTETLESMLKSSAKSSLAERLALLLRMAIPSMLAELSFVAMQCIDAAMVGRLGADDAAAIGLVAAATWVFGSLCYASSVGFTVQTAQALGASDTAFARSILRQGLMCCAMLSLVLAATGLASCKALPVWLGGTPEITAKASGYFAVCSLCLPLLAMDALCSGMLQANGNMRTPSILNIAMCFMDVVFNFFLIFPSREVSFMGLSLFVPGFDLGIVGAALGTALAEGVTALLMAWMLLAKDRRLGLRRSEKFRFEKGVVRRAIHLAAPVAFESATSTGAMVVATAIVAPLGATALAANSFAITAEGVCYMPGYGIRSAATTLTGQAVGAKRGDLAKTFAWMSTWMGIGIMTLCGGVLFVSASGFMSLLTPDAAIRAAGAEVLRIEAFAEPFFAAAIVAGGALRGAGDTLIPSILNFSTMWFVRLPLAAMLAPRTGLRGAWVAMALELGLRGSLMLARLKSGRWIAKAIPETRSPSAPQT